MRIEGRLVESGGSVRVEVSGAAVSRIVACDTDSQHWIAPGFIDLQVNGFAGYDLNRDGVTAADVQGVVEALWREGVTSLCPTVITNSEARICRSLEAIARLCADSPRHARSIPAVHVEGPSISAEDGPRGAHALEHIRPPSLSEFGRWQEAAGGRVGLVTLAPELPGALDYIAALVRAGTVVAIGHTAAGEAEIRAAVDAGARLSTHLGNGAHAQVPRHPNYIWEQLADDRLVASLICDGQHLPPAVMRVMLRAKGIERAILVSDAVALAGSPPGHYQTAVGGQVDLSPDGRLTLAGTPYLAGSVASLPHCLANVLRYCDVTLPQAVRLVTANPARLLGLDAARGHGSVRVGLAADLTVFSLDAASGKLIVQLTLVGGEVVYRRSA